MSLVQKGFIIQKGETQQVSEKFKKREFVIQIDEEINGNTYTNYGKFQLVQNKCDILDRFKEGDRVEVNFNIKGNRWERDGKINYITNLDAWKIEPAAQSYPAYQPPQPPQQAASTPAYNANNNSGNFSPSPETIDDLPF